MIASLDTKQYKILCQWWNSRGFPSIPYDSLPSTSYFVYNNSTPILFGVVYFSSDEACKAALTSWYTANPASSQEEKMDALVIFENFVTELCKEKQIPTIICFTSKETHLEKLKLCGYIPVEAGTMCLRKIGE